MKRKYRKQIQSFMIATIALALFYVYIVAGSLEYGSVTVGQALISGLAGCLYMTVAVITYKILGKEEEY